MMNYSDKQIQILTTAERLFSTKGFDGTSVRDIADEAGVNIAMISYYFGSKEKLMEALFSQRSDEVRLEVESLLQNDEIAPFQKMERLVDSYIERVMNKQKFFKIMICEQVINKNPVIISLILNLKKKNIEAISKIIKDGQKKGVFKKEIDVMLMINTLIGSITQMMLTSDYYRDFNGLQNLSDEEFLAQIRQRQSNHIKVLFKAILTYEA